MMDRKYDVFFRYRKIIFAVILFMVADSLVIGINFYSTFLAGESAVSINLSGRQRMLSQRMTKVLLLTQRDLEAADKDQVAKDLAELKLTVGLFDTTLKGFRDGDTVKGGDMKDVYLTQVGTEESRQFVTDTYAIWEPYLQKLRPILDHYKQVEDGDISSDELVFGLTPLSPSRLEEAIIYAQANNLKVLTLMNNLTSDLETVANRRARNLRIILSIGIIIALINFGYTVVVSIQDLMKSDKDLNQSRKETAEILSTVHEGLFLLDKNKKIGTQFSDAMPNILGIDIKPNMDFLPILKSLVSKNVYDSAVDYIELLLGERVKEVLVASLNPLTNVQITLNDQSGAVAKNRFLTFFFNRVITEEKLSHLLVTIQDVTDKVMLLQTIERAKNQTKTEIETLLRLASSDFDSLFQFIDNTGRSLAQINEKMSQPQDDVRERLHTLNYIMRVVHGIKGDAAVLGIEVIENYAHDCEKEITAMRESEDQVSSDQILRIAVLLEGFYERHSSLAQIVSRFGEAMGKKPGTKETGTENVQHEHPFAEHIATLAQRIAMDHEKRVEVSCQLEKLFSLPEPVVQQLQSISVQLVRNALSHGIESPSERMKLKKPGNGALALLCEYLGNGQYNFTVRDDGCGIVPERLRQNFVKNGRISAKDATTMSNKEIARLIFQPGVSTAETADKDAGHGVGLDVVLEKVKAMGGHLLVKSRPDMFTEFHIRFSVAA